MTKSQSVLACAIALACCSLVGCTSPARGPVAATKLPLVVRVEIPHDKLKYVDGMWGCFIETGSLQPPVVCMADNANGAEFQNLIVYAHQLKLGSKSGVNVVLHYLKPDSQPLSVLTAGLSVNVMQEDRTVADPQPVPY